MNSINRLIYMFGLLSVSGLFAQEGAVDEERAASLVLLDEVAVRNLGIETVEALETDFEETIFAIGRIRAVPTRNAVVSSRIAGRVVEIKKIEGDLVEKGEEIVLVESLQPGNPPPVITLKAPIAGMVTESHTRLGEPIEPAKELLDIIDLTKVWAIAQVPEAEVGKLDVGSKAHIRMPAMNGDSFDGTLIRFGTAADETAGTLEAVFEIDNAESRLRPGMRAEFSIVVSTRRDVMSVPRESIQGDPTKRIVFVKDYELPNAFVRAPVLLGQQNEEFVEIINGLFPGDEVVTEGSYSLAFAGGGSGISLKEALDAAHGHEHNEDGSEMTDEQKAGAGDHSGHDHGGGGASVLLTRVLIGYSIGISLLFIVVLQLLITSRRKSNPETPVKA